MIWIRVRRWPGCGTGRALRFAPVRGSFLQLIPGRQIGLLMVGRRWRSLSSVPLLAAHLSVRRVLSLITCTVVHSQLILLLLLLLVGYSFLLLSPLLHQLSTLVIRKGSDRG